MRHLLAGNLLKRRLLNLILACWPQFAPKQRIAEGLALKFLYSSLKRFLDANYNDGAGNRLLLVALIHSRSFAIGFGLIALGEPHHLNAKVLR